MECAILKSNSQALCLLFKKVLCDLCQIHTCLWLKMVPSRGMVGILLGWEMLVFRRLLFCINVQIAEK